MSCRSYRYLLHLVNNPSTALSLKKTHELNQIHILRCEQISDLLPYSMKNSHFAYIQSCLKNYASLITPVSVFR